VGVARIAYPMTMSIRRFLPPHPSNYQASAPAPIARPDFRPLRQPIIRAKICQSISDLIPFLSHLSVVMYESSYALSGPGDMETCERRVLEDIFREG
jgi:hypothetical protein